MCPRTIILASLPLEAVTTPRLLHSLWLDGWSVIAFFKAWGAKLIHKTNKADWQYRVTRHVYSRNVPDTSFGCILRRLFVISFISNDGHVPRGVDTKQKRQFSIWNLIFLNGQQTFKKIDSTPAQIYEPSFLSHRLPKSTRKTGKKLRNSNTVYRNVHNWWSLNIVIKPLLF